MSQARARWCLVGMRSRREESVPTRPIPTTAAPTAHVVVVGGGYAGVLAANRLTSRRDVAVTLVNPRAAFVERIRLHQLVAGTHDAVVDPATVLGSRVRRVVGEVARIDAAGRRVELADGGALAYDHLLYTVGSGSAQPHVPGVREHAYALATLEEAERLRAVVRQLSPGAPLVVVGAGPSGIETAAELAGLGTAGAEPVVTLVCGGLLGPYLHPAGRRAVAGRLAALGVRVVDGPGSAVVAVTADGVRLGDGRELRSAATVWTAGFGVPDLAARSGLSTDPVGRLLTDETLTSVDDDRIVAAGDAAAPSGVPYRMSCQAAGQLGLHAAGTVLRRLAGEEPEPVRLGFVGQCLSLGRHDGLVQLAHRDDTARAAHVGGRTGARLKELVCRSTVAQLRLEARWPGMVAMPGWVGDPHRAAAVAATRASEPVR